MFLGLGKNFGTPRRPPKTPRGSPRGLERVSEEAIEIWHVGYQFSEFSALKMNTGSKLLKNFESDSHGVAYGGPWFKGPLGRSSKNITI
jgi:hypothetical protein